MKFQFFGRMPSLNASVLSDGTSSHGDNEPCLHSTIVRQTSQGTDEDTVISIFELDNKMDSVQTGRAVNAVSTICSMVKSENGGPYDPSNKHMYNLNETDNDSTNPVDQKCRTKMLEWCFKMVDFFNIDRSIVSIAISYQDRFLSTSMGSTARTRREIFRIASVTCLYIAIKLYVPDKWNVTAHAFAQLCRGTISGNCINDMEMQILFALGWNVHPPVPWLYVEQIVDLITTTLTAGNEELRQGVDISDEDSVLGDLILPSLSHASYSDRSTSQEYSTTAMKENVLELVRYQVELTLQKIEFLHIHSSLIALAALMNAIEGIISENDAQVTPFCRHSVAIMSKVMTYSEICTKRELDEVCTVLLCSAMAEPSSDNNTLMNVLDKGQPTPKSPPGSIIGSPTSASNWNQYPSPKSVLSRVCVMHSQQHSNQS